ncbi:hypothetical protein [Sphingomonas immobilis]|uniref:Uncharacterized protein n=1 Tax=Sphingomonas immobilis TaxID=3063997 RepID=A0ABT8ZWI6_9SPHN|nr:hypothetical protein [Sphingomonas sp. CA1-15]MDO7841577.1 hypothetical protein [Sphingomonas sp. CA1-15]
MTPPTPAEAAGDARWLAHRYDPQADAVHFLPVSRADHAGATFLTDEYLPAGLTPLVVRRSEAMAAAPPPAPLHFLFHSAYCCSTLLARAADRPGWAMGLKEPVILNDINGWRRRGGRGPDMAQVLADTLTLLARPFGAGEAVIAKPSTAVNGLAQAMLTLRPEAHAILMYAPLRTYLASIAKKGIDGRLWVRTLLNGMLDDRLIDLGFEPRDYLGQTDLQVAAVGWLAHQMLFARLVAAFPGRVRTLDSATLLADPGGALRAMGMLFGKPLDNAAVAEMLAGPAFRTHSKSGAAFDAGDRASEHDAAARVHADEIDKVAIWAEAVAAGAGVSLTLPAALV